MTSLEIERQINFCIFTFIFDGAKRHIEEWTYLQNGKEETTRFDFRRKQ
jgi:hypothetical protein